MEKWKDLSQQILKMITDQHTTYQIKGVLKPAFILFYFFFLIIHFNYEGVDFVGKR